MAVSLLDSWTVTGTGLGNPGSFSVSSGSDRLLILVTYSRAGSAIPITAVTYGGESMTPLFSLPNGVATTSGPDMNTQIWILDDADIESASGTSFSPTPSSGATTARFIAACYEGVDQTDPINDQFSATAIGGGNPTTEALTTTADSFAVAALIANRGTSDVGATENASYTNMTEQLEETVSDSYTSIAHAATSGSNFTPGTTIVHQSAAHLLAISLEAASSTIDLGGSIDAVSGSTSDLKITTDLFGAITSASGSSADLAHDINISGSVVAVSGSTANLTQQKSVSSLGESVSGGSANASVLNLASSTGVSVSGGSANASLAKQVSATGASISGGSANASRITVLPGKPLKESFLQFQRPVFLVDLFLDSGELNIWTRPVPGFFALKEYRPLAGITSGLSFRNSLEFNATESSIQLSGRSQELLNIALQEDFQNREAQVFLGNIDDSGEIDAASIVLSGTIVNMTVSDTRQDSTVSVIIESLFKTINQSDLRRLSSGDQKLEFPDDTFFDFVETVQANTPRFGD